MAMLGVRYDLRLPGAHSEERKRFLDVALDQIEWADRLGFGSATLSEHHGSPDGYLPSPMVFAAAVATRTNHLFINIGALIVPLHDPLRIAEDLAVVDLLSGGRLVVTVAAGYVEAEFEMFGKRLADRGAAVERTVEVLKTAWTGEPFELDGRTVRVTPRPFQDPRPMILMGGQTRVAARRAARIADGYVPVSSESWDHYRAALVELGRPDPGPAAPRPPRFLYVADDPERAWARIAPACLHETNAYGTWGQRAGLDNGYRVFGDDADALRASGMYPVLTPDACIELVRSLGPAGALVFHPLCGGMDPDLSWESLHLFEQRVLPTLMADSAPLA
jgi:alkanesulfonate monooxygenase SsuD/methylene tetrahydromethanopterin reductase-like flavin-dependent oxidoreductase (luciferase family)